MAKSTMGHGFRQIKGRQLRISPAGKTWVEVPSSPSLNLTDAITLDLHFKTYGATGSWQCVLAKRDDGNGLQKVQYQLALTRDLELSYCICTGGPNEWWLPPTGIRLRPNQWYHVVANYNAFQRQVTIFVDGTMKTTLTDAPAIRPCSNPVRIGWSGWQDEFFNGEVRDVRIINTLARDIAALKAKGMDHPVLVRVGCLPHRYRSAADGLQGIVEADALNPQGRPSRVTLRVRNGGKTTEEISEVGSEGYGRVKCIVPELLADSQAEIELVQEGKTVAKQLVTITGTKEALGYRVFVVSHTHSDLCWPNSIQACLDANVAAIAKSVEIAERVPNYRFTMEHALFLREYLRRYPDKQAVVKKLMQAGVIEIGGFLYRPLGTDLWRRRARAATVSGQTLDQGASGRRSGDGVERRRGRAYRPDAANPAQGRHPRAGDLRRRHRQHLRAALRAA